MVLGVNEIFRHQSDYQLIQVFEDPAGLGRILSLDGVVQLTTWDQHRYHESLVAVPYLFTRFAKNVAILGGGDGYAAKLLLDHFPVEHVVLVELDPAVIETSKSFFDFPDDDRLEVLPIDATGWAGIQLDMIIMDLTDPTNASCAPLYTTEFLTSMRERLTPEGVFVTQMVAPVMNPKAAACMCATVMTAFKGYGVFPYRVHLTHHQPPAQNGFVLASPQPMQLTLPGGFRYLNDANLVSMFQLDNDEYYDTEGVGPSTEENLLYTRLFRTPYNSDVEEWEVDNES